jgi:hypothetical protein
VISPERPNPHTTEQEKTKTMPKPTSEQIQEAGRQLQRGGFLGRGSARKAGKLVEEAVAAGMDRQTVAMEILSAAADYQPRPWAR